MANELQRQVIRITPKNRPPLPTTYKLHGHTLDTVDASKYLGVTISNNLTWDRHIDNTIGKGNKTLGFIRRNLKDCTKPVKSAAYTSMVRPTMEYASSVWDRMQAQYGTVCKLSMGPDKPEKDWQP